MQRLLSLFQEVVAKIDRVTRDTSHEEQLPASITEIGVAQILICDCAS